MMVLVVDRKLSEVPDEVDESFRNGVHSVRKEIVSRLWHQSNIALLGLHSVRIAATDEHNIVRDVWISRSIGQILSSMISATID